MKNRCISLLLLVCLITGCTHNELTEVPKANAGMNLPLPVIQDNTVNPAYEVPESKPNILVDQVGYRSDSRKIAVLRGKALPDTYIILDASSKEQVYTGKVEKKVSAQPEDEIVGYANFSDFKVSGTFYIQADRIGESYPFSISENLYQDLFILAAQVFSQDSSEYTQLNTKDLCAVLTSLLLSYELHLSQSDTYAPYLGETITSYAQQLMVQQDKKTGSFLISKDEEDKTTAYAAAVLAKYSYHFNKKDEAFANECLQAAKKAWKYAVKNKDTIEKETLVYAASELFRKTGQSSYHKVVAEYMEENNSMEGGFMSPGFYAAITYLLTQGKVDIDICSEIMDQLMAKTSEISKTARGEPYLALFGEGEQGMQVMLDNMVKIAVIDDVFTNYEYTTAMENHIHYLLGRNPDGVSYLGGFGSVVTDNQELDIVKNPVYQATFLFMLGAIVKYEEEKQ